MDAFIESMKKKSAPEGFLPIEFIIKEFASLQSTDPQALKKKACYALQHAWEKQKPGRSLLRKELCKRLRDMCNPRSTTPNVRLLPVSSLREILSHVFKDFCIDAPVAASASPSPSAPPPASRGTNNKTKPTENNDDDLDVGLEDLMKKDWRKEASTSGDVTQAESTDVERSSPSPSSEDGEDEEVPETPPVTWPEEEEEEQGKRSVERSALSNFFDDSDTEEIELVKRQQDKECFSGGLHGVFFVEDDASTKDKETAGLESAHEQLVDTSGGEEPVDMRLPGPLRVSHSFFEEEEDVLSVLDAVLPLREEPKKPPLTPVVFKRKRVLDLDTNSDDEYLGPPKKASKPKADARPRAKKAKKANASQKKEDETQTVALRTNARKDKAETVEERVDKKACRWRVEGKRCVCDLYDVAFCDAFFGEMPQGKAKGYLRNPQSVKHYCLWFLHKHFNGGDSRAKAVLEEWLSTDIDAHASSAGNLLSEGDLDRVDNKRVRRLMRMLFDAPGVDAKRDNMVLWKAKCVLSNLVHEIFSVCWEKGIKWEDFVLPMVMKATGRDRQGVDNLFIMGALFFETPVFQFFHGKRAPDEEAVARFADHWLSITNKCLEEISKGEFGWFFLDEKTNEPLSGYMKRLQAVKTKVNGFNVKIAGYYYSPSV